MVRSTFGSSFSSLSSAGTNSYSSESFKVKMYSPGSVTSGSYLTGSASMSSFPSSVFTGRIVHFSSVSSYSVPSASYALIFSGRLRSFSSVPGSKWSFSGFSSFSKDVRTIFPLPSSAAKAVADGTIVIRSTSDIIIERYFIQFFTFIKILLP